MTSRNDTEVGARPASVRTSPTHRFRGLVDGGLAATLAAMVATTLAALLGLHLVPAAVMIPTLARSLRTRTD